MNFQRKFDKEILNNPFTVPIQQADGLEDKFKEMKDRNDEYTQEPFKSLLECASFVKTREELLQKLFKLFTGLAALDNATTRKNFPMNFWDPLVIAANVIQNIGKAIKKREKALICFEQAIDLEDPTLKKAKLIINNHKLDLYGF